MTPLRDLKPLVWLLVTVMLAELIMAYVGCCIRCCAGGKKLAEEEAPKSGKFMQIWIILTIVFGNLSIVAFGLGFVWLISVLGGH